MNPKDPQKPVSRPLSPYPLVAKETNSGVIYQFTTDYDITYSLIFSSDEGWLQTYPSIAPLVFSVALVAHSDDWTSHKDARVERTVTHGLQAAFDSQSALVINFVCSLEGNYERLRRLTFGRWYSQHSAIFDQVEFSSGRTYAAAIFRRDNPQADLVKHAFSILYYTDKEG